MGMDVYGLNPKLKSEKPKLDWNTASEKERDDYFEQMNKFEEENKGYYFRNNVWHWRPLARERRFQGQRYRRKRNCQAIKILN